MLVPGGTRPRARSRAASILAIRRLAALRLPERRPRRRGSGRGPPRGCARRRAPACARPAARGGRAGRPRRRRPTSTRSAPANRIASPRPALAGTSPARSARIEIERSRASGLRVRIWSRSASASSELVGAQVQRHDPAGPLARERQARRSARGGARRLSRAAGAKAVAASVSCPYDGSRRWCPGSNRGETGTRCGDLGRGAPKPWLPPQL